MRDATQPISTSRAPRLRWSIAVLAAVAAVLALSVMIDPIPRFFQGDSISYLMTGIDWIPPDRSWAFGYLVHGLVVRTHGFHAFIILSNIVLWAAIACGRFWFAGRGRRAALGYATFALLAVLDPLLAIYTRFYMSDLFAFVCFLGFLAAFRRGLRQGRRFAPALLAMAAFAVAAVFLRVAYAAVIEGTAVIVLVASLWSVSIPQRARIGAVMLLPMVAVGVLGIANTIVFGREFHHEFFINKLSGSLLMSVFAPAIDRSDFAAAGVKLSKSEFDDLVLGDYDKRGNVTFRADRYGATFLIGEKLGVHDGYDDRLNRICGRIVRHAAERDPAAIARIYGWTLATYVEPSRWRYSFPVEIGTHRPLPLSFVTMMNSFGGHELYPSITARRSIVLGAFMAVMPIYPRLLLVLSALALLTLATRRAQPGALVASAGLLGSLLAAPIYSEGVTPRYVLPTIFLGYLLIGSWIAGRSRE